MLSNIPFDRSEQFGQELKALFNSYRKVVTDGPNIVTIFSDFIDGDGTSETHFQALVDRGTFPTLTAAKASWDELNSCNTQVQTIAAALNQICAKHAIV